MNETPASFGALNYTVLVLYLAAMIGIGAALARRQKTTSDFFLAGRRLPWIAVAMSMYASVTSAMTFMGLPGMAYQQNISLVLVCLISPLVAPLLVLVFYPLYRKLSLTTSYEYIALRFGRGARQAVALLFVLARLSWVGTVIYAPALALHVTTGIPLAGAIAAIGLLATLYCVLGGLSAVVWTDVPQFIIMIGGAVWMAVLLCGMVPDGAVGILREGHLADKLKVFDWSFDPLTMNALAVVIAYPLLLVLDYGIDQVAVQRLLAVKTDRGVTRAILFNALVDFFIIALLLFIGLGLFVYGQQDTGLIPADITGSRVLPWFIQHHLPLGVSGLLIAALFAAAMSSVDSGLNSLTTVILHDLATPLSGRGPAHPFPVRTARLLTAALGLAATAVSLFIYQRIGGIIQAFYTYLALFSAPVLALFLLGLFTRRANTLGWLIGAVTGMAVLLVIRRHTGLIELYQIPLATLVATSVGYLASLFTPAGDAQPAYRWREVMRR